MAQNSERIIPSVGYDDTPQIPGQKWHVHDGNRPQPRIVTPGKTAADAPSDAVVLFDGSDLSKWKGNDGEPQWKLDGDFMEVAPGTGGIETKEHFGTAQYHLEWAAPEVVKGDSQGRGNSGVFLMGRYEIQVLDGYDNPTYADGITAAIYGQCPPLVNACRKPGEWQTYDIIFVAPEFDGDKVVSPAYVTVIQNGVLVHHHKELIGATNHRVVGTYEEHPPKGPLALQDHGDLVRFRNIWVRELTDYDE